MTEPARAATPPQEKTVQQLFDLSGRSAIVTGGCGHLGSAMCRALAEAGATVIVSSREADRAQAMAATLPTPHGNTAGGAKHIGIALDHMRPDTLAASFEAALAATGRVDILVNNGHEALAADWSTVTPEDFTHHLANATGYFTLAKLVRDHAVERGAAASVILIGSMYGVVGSYPDAYEGICAASPVAYHTLKGGLIHMTRHLAVYWGADRVRVNCLSPGPFPGAKAPAAMVERLKTKSPLGRMGSAGELKGALLLLASDAGSYITGQNLLVDGGWTAW
jgi:NAD(P)-dependent dehydrogenase (short-subunit alcohol dehydrogenase family)